MRKLNQPTAARVVKQANGDWYILWRVPSDEGKNIRYRYKNGLNRIKNLELREAWANKIVAFINAAALNGAAPSQIHVESYFDTIHFAELPPSVYSPPKQVYRQYDVMTCHTARRTFATIAFVEWNMPSALVMQATGHKSERDFLKFDTDIEKC